MTFDTETPTPNVPLLRKVVEWVEEQDALDSAVTDSRTILDDRWNQHDWLLGQVKDGHSCGTAMCCAGAVVTWDGWKPVWRKDSQPDGDGNFRVSAHTVTDGEEEKDVEVLATKLLGLTGTQASKLFESTNGAETIRRLAEGFAGERL